ncbi:hypothetical protein DL546_001158 [Coniochaeta pulveracea]|uniref:Secreted protein n=1 Tax=Coniochaeta pulveracea TaxID=177199 RepID=A0A420XY59_9PEZI|nr:hypothetical protein DL546_001158 [Coniochaeta pulveracea]
MWLRSSASWLLALIFCVSVQVAAVSYAHAYDKIWLYYVYNLAWKLDGPSQRYILRFLDPKNPADRQMNNQNINKGNRGSLPNGQLTWEEFQWSLNWALADKTLNPVPELSDDFDKLAKQLWQTSWMGSEIKLGVAQSLRVQKGSRAPPGFLEYTDYIHSLTQMVEQAKIRLSGPDVAADLDKLHKLADKIVQIREVEFRQSKYLGEDLKKVFPGINIVEEEVPNPDPKRAGETKYNFKLVNTLKTLEDPVTKAAIKAALGLQGDTSDKWKSKFIERVNRYGMETWNGAPIDPPYEEEARRHRKTLTAWRRAFAVSSPGPC